jgi:hypothetical protein
MSDKPSRAGEVALPQADPNEKITVMAGSAMRWREGAYDVWLLSGNCVIQQGASTARSEQAVLWIENNTTDESARNKIIAIPTIAQGYTERAK